VLRDTLGSPRRDDPSFLKVAEDDGSGFVYALITVVRPRGVRISKAYQPLVSIVGWFAHPSMKPAFVEECDNSPTFTLVAAVGREDEVGKSCQVKGRDVVM
jgi:hypothetical protein